MSHARPLTRPASAPEHPIRILVVDDDPLMREVASAQLSLLGSRVVTAEDGEAALGLLVEGFDLIVTDLDMPRLDGFALLDRIRQSPHLGDIPVVVITSSSDMAAVNRAYETGATAFIQKPVNWGLFGYQVRSVIRGAAIEVELRAARDSARHAADVERNLLTMLQHEARTPLHAIVGHCEILNGLVPPDAINARAEAGRVLRAAWQLNETLRRVFYFSQLTAGTLPLDPELIPVSTIVGEAVRAVRARAAEIGIPVRVEPGAADPKIACDLRVLSAALNELLANGLTHTGAGATVTVGWRVLPNGTAVLEIADDGPGLPPDRLAECQAGFGQGGDPLTRQGEGLGIGLAMARRIAELHGGGFSLSSEPGCGTAARLTLPIAGAEQPPQA
jgi:two-component system sensor histidine kinase/response regulator